LVHIFLTEVRTFIGDTISEQEGKNNAPHETYKRAC